jgi:hypothetical protein
LILSTLSGVWYTGERLVYDDGYVGEVDEVNELGDVGDVGDVGEVGCENYDLGVSQI